MKIIIDKKAITIDEAQEAKQLQRDYGEILDNNMIEILANKASGARWGKLISVEKMEVTKNHHQLTVWATVILETPNAFFKTSFDVLQADRQQDDIDNFTRVFKLAAN